MPMKNFIKKICKRLFPGRGAIILTAYSVIFMFIWHIEKYFIEVPYKELIMPLLMIMAIAGWVHHVIDCIKK